MSACADWFSEQVDAHLARLDEGWEQDCDEWARVERTTDELRHNLDWRNVLHWIQRPELYLPRTAH